MSLAEKRLFLLDMDGTIYLSETLFDGTLDFLRYVRAIGGRDLFLTNNSSRGTGAYIAKMARLGIEAFPDDFLTSADAAIRYLRGRYRPETVYYVCGAGICRIRSIMSAERNLLKISFVWQGCE